MDRMTETEARELLEYIYNKPSYLFLGQAYQRESLNKNSYLDKLYAEAGCSDSIHSWRNLLEDHSDSIDQIYDTAADLSVSVSVPFLSELVNLPWNLFITSYYKRVVFIDRSPAGCYNNYRVLWIGLYHLPSNGFAEAPTTASLLKC